MPFPLQVQRFARLLQKKLGIQGFIGVTLVEDVAPMVALLTGDAPEDSFLREELRFGQMLVSVAVVGQFSQVIFGNPAGSGVLAIIERMATPGCNLGPTAPQPPYTQSIAPLDQRAPYAAAAPTRAACGMRALSNAATIIGDNIDNKASFFGAAAYTEYQAPRIVLPPGAAFGFEGRVVNEAIFASVWWREYRAAPQEFTSG